jgi:glutathione S-transferase
VRQDSREKSQSIEGRIIMAEYVDIETAIGMSGVRVTLPPGVPGPWGEGLKGILHVKKIPFTRVRHDRTNYEPLLRWTAQSSTPVMAYNGERPRSVWSDQLFLAERLQPDPALIPQDINDRVLMFGLCNEICGENGFGWSRRLMLVDGAARDPKATEEVRKGMLAFGSKYGYSAGAVSAAPARVARIAATLADRLEAQRVRGSRFFIGEQLSALDIYWAAFAALIEPLPENLCPMAAGFRRSYTCNDATVRAATTPELLAHRDFIYKDFLELPVDL